MKLYTKTGDKGETGLASGTRVKKVDQRIIAIGDVDELNSFIGLARTEAKYKPESDDDSLLETVQSELFKIGAILAGADFQITSEEVAQIESHIDAATSEVQPLSNFILPGGSKYASLLHVCRSVSRRAERSVLLLKETAPVSEQLCIYLNRLSDLFFALARKANKEAGVEDTIWKSVQ